MVALLRERAREASTHAVPLVAVTRREASVLHGRCGPYSSGRHFDREDVVETVTVYAVATGEQVAQQRFLPHGCPYFVTVSSSDSTVRAYVEDRDIERWLRRMASRNFR